MPQIEIQTRKDIAAFLPCAIESALESYITFSQEEATNAQKKYNAKDFKAHHDACKVAIAHIELLIKLARWADLPDPKLENADKQAMLCAILENANGELDRN